MLGDKFMIVNINWDDTAGVWIAINDEIGLTLEDASYDNLTNRLKQAIPEMCELNNVQMDSYIFINTAVRKMVCM